MYRFAFFALFFLAPIAQAGCETFPGDLYSLHFRQDREATDAAYSKLRAVLARLETISYSLEDLERLTEQVFLLPAPSAAAHFSLLDSAFIRLTHVGEARRRNSKFKLYDEIYLIRCLVSLRRILARPETWRQNDEEWKADLVFFGLTAVLSSLQPRFFERFPLEAFALRLETVRIFTQIGDEADSMRVVESVLREATSNIFPWDRGTSGRLRFLGISMASEIVGNWIRNPKAFAQGPALKGILEGSKVFLDDEVHSPIVYALGSYWKSRQGSAETRSQIADMFAGWGIASQDI